MTLTLNFDLFSPWQQRLHYEATLVPNLNPAPAPCRHQQMRGSQKPNYVSDFEDLDAYGSSPSLFLFMGKKFRPEFSSASRECLISAFTVRGSDFIIESWIRMKCESVCNALRQ